jgi:hypothetical protein
MEEEKQFYRDVLRKKISNTNDTELLKLLYEFIALNEKKE